MKKYHVVSIGISAHQESFVPNLEYAHKDAVDFFNLVTRNVSEVGYKALLTDSEATLSKIRTALGSDLQKEVGEEDCFFFFYSGHGTIADEPGNNSIAHYVLPFDATRDVQNSCIPVTYLKEVFENLKCRASIVFLDSCFSGGINSKHFPNPRTKSLKSVKTFTNTLAGKGSMVFTASKDDEEAIEDSELKSGLFTHCLLEELQKERDGDHFSVVDTFTPVVEAVTKRAKELHGRIQTPTFKGHLEGIIYLPTFKNKLKYTPEIIDLPLHPETVPQNFLIPEIEIEDKKQKKLVDDTVAFVINTSKGQNSVQERIVFEGFCSKLLKELKDKWEIIFAGVGGNAQGIPEAVAKLEAESFQLVLLGCVVGLFGSGEQMEIYGRYISKILEWEKGRAGLVALISVPEIVVAEIFSSIGIVSIANDNLEPFRVLLNTQVVLDYRNPPRPLYSFEGIFYCDALSGYSNKVHDHIREVLKNYKWLTALCPNLEDKTDDLQLQTNFLLVILSVLNDGRLWADFGRFYGSRIIPIVHKIKYDGSFQGQLAGFLGVKKEEVRDTVIKALKEILESWRTRGSSFLWESINVEDFYTETELEELKRSFQN